MAHFTSVLLISCVITAISNFSHMVILTTAMTSSYKCEEYSSTTVVDSGYTVQMLLKQYVLDTKCTGIGAEFRLTTPETIQRFVLVSLLFSLFSLIASCVLCIIASCGWCKRRGYLFITVHLVAYVAVVMVDVVITYKFGIDYTKLSLPFHDDSRPRLDLNVLKMLRVVTLSLMVLSLKGLLVHMVNLALDVAIICMIGDYIRRRNLDNEILHNHHSIYRHGVLYAFEDNLYI